MISNVIIIGGGLLGNEIKNQIISQNGKAKIIKNIGNNDVDIIPKDTEVVIFVAQSKDYKEKTMTEDLSFCNTILPLKILFESHKLGVKKFGFCSTGSIYSNRDDYHKESEQLPEFSDSPDSATKTAAEILLESNKNLFERFVIYRPFFIYGKNQTGEKIIPRMINSVKNHEEITLAQNKGMIFNPIYVSDAARFVLESLERKSGFDIYNVGGNEEISLKKLVDLISEKLQKEPKIKTTENKPAYVLGSIEKMKLENFSHEITLHDGIDKILD